MIDSDVVQPGWHVYDAHGDEIGTVVEVETHQLTVKKGGLMGGHVTIPRDTITEVETGRVEINREKSELG